MDTATVIAIAAVLVAMCGTAITYGSLKSQARQLDLERELRTLEYVTAQFDRLADIGARAALNEILDNGTTVADFALRGNVEHRKMLEYVFTFNRIATGVWSKTLHEDVLFTTWTPQWFREHWARFETFIQKERLDRMGQTGAVFARPFEWLTTQRCQEVEGIYPPPEMMQVPMDTPE